ncbi:MAG: PP2C family protein-serine/threonine phosphatase [Prevotella sp.]|nr:PP2C family protein-serine/threonine phosphatase [Prevotella sp.]
MSKKILCSLTLVGTIAVTLFLSGCGGDSKEQERQRREAEDMVYKAYLDKDYPRIIELVDSFKPLGSFSEGKACYWMGYAYDRMMQKRMAELYWKTGIAAVENSTDDEDVRVYAGITNRLTGLFTTWTEYEAALKVAIPATERLKSLGRDTTSEYTNMLIYIGCAQSRFGLKEDKNNKSLEEAYSAHLDNIRRHPNAISFRDAIVGVINICYNFLEMADYEKAELWLGRMGQLIDGYEKQADARSDYAEKQRARYNIYLARALEGLGRRDEAAEAYRLFCQSEFFKTAEGKILASDYLRLAGRWQDAADNFSNLNTLMEEQNVGYSLENIQKMLLKKFDVNRRAGRMDSANAVSIDIIEHLDSAITQSRRADAIEQEAVHKKELEMTAENERYVRNRHIGRIIGMSTLILFLIIYIIVRHRTGVRLKKAHNALQTAYDQLEETTTAKERMESELRIARDIQMSMVPSVFPEIDGLDMYASMTPAREVGGDLYNFLRKGDKLYFCIGDVSGKGVPASLFMTLATRGFLTLASTGRNPAEIATRMNVELSNNNEMGMFVTMFICAYHLKDGRLEYCNAGHNPPIIGNAEGQYTFLDVKEANAPIGLWPDLEYVGEEMNLPSNSMMLLYTDGLNEAENRQQEQYGEDRIIQLMTSHASLSTRDMIEALKADTDQFRDGAEQNDDLTMLAFSFTS